LYGNNTNFGGSYFEWFIFQVADIQPATPTGGSWNFTTNTGTPPAGWLTVPPANPTNTVWVSIALVNSKTASTLTWSVPGKFSYASGLPILSGNGTPSSTLGQSDQLYIELDIAPQTIWFKTAGTWTRLTGSSLYVDLTSNQTIGGTKTFSNQIQGSVSGTSTNVTGVVGISNGGTGSTTSAGARTALGAASSGANSDITSLSGLTTPLSVGQGGTGATTAAGARTSLGLGSAATQDSTAFATAAQGVKADTAVQTIGSIDGSVNITGTTAIDLSVAVAAATNNVICQVRNTTGATLTKGTVVYITGATGQIPTVTKAQANSDASSAQTLGMMTADLANNSNGNVTIIGLITNINTSAYTDGAQLYLSGTVAGGVTTTKPYAPTHLVYVGVVEYAHPTQGKIFVKVQNGYELDELHNVSAQTPSNGQTIIYNSSTSLWENNTVSLTAGVNGILPVLNGGTGVTTSTGSGSVVLATSPTLVTPALGTPSSGNFSTGTFTWPTFNQNTTGNAATATTATNVSGGTASVTTLTTSSTVTLNGGTANGIPYLNGSKVLTSGSALTFDGTNLATTGKFISGGSGGSNGYFQLNRTDAANLGSIQWVTSGDEMRYSNNNGGFHSWYIGSEGMRLNTTGLGIGTSSPSYKLDVSATGTTVSSAFRSDQSQMWVMLKDSGTTLGAVRIGSEAGSFIAYANGNQLVYNSSGNLGLGVTPSAGAVWVNFQTQRATLTGGANDRSESAYNSYRTSGQYTYIGSDYASIYQQTSGQHRWFTAPSGTAGNAISFTQAMTLDAGGNLLVGTTSIAGAGGLTIQPNTSAGATAMIFNRASSTGTSYPLDFRNGGSTVGYVSYTNLAVVYATMSDYRLKTVLGSVTGSGARIDALEPIEYEWKTDGSRTRGFLAHKFQEVYAGSVTGTKDAVDKEGKPVYQAMQAGSSEVIADLVAEIQSLRKRLAAAGI
jgi:hypothetical protein